MDLTQLRRMVRASIQARLNETAVILTSAPKNLSEFRLQFIVALGKVKASPSLILQVENEVYAGGRLFEDVYAAYKYIAAELKDVPQRQRDVEYRSIAPECLYEMACNVLSGERTNVPLLASRIVEAMLQR
jgi:hypothetical protein